MQQKLMVSLLISFLILFVQSLNAQVIVHKPGAGGSEVFFLNELAAIISEKDGIVSIGHAMPKDQRPEAYRDIDVKQGDEILMVNAQRLKAVKDLGKIYNELEVGAALKFGVRRGEEMFIVSVNKMDPEKLPKRTLMIRRGDPASMKLGEENKIVSEQIKIDNKDGKVDPLLEFGLILKEVDNKVIIDRVIADQAQKTAAREVKAGDVITALNGEKILTIQQFRAIYNKIEAGKNVNFAMLQATKELKISLIKPKAAEVMIFQKN